MRKEVKSALLVCFVLVGAIFVFLSVKGVLSDGGVVRGDLGGVAVEIPRAYARFVEFDERSMNMIDGLKIFPEGRQLSKLRSFGFDVRYPDMASVEVKKSVEGNSLPMNWMWVGVTTGEAYGFTGDDFLENRKNHHLGSGRPCFSKCFLFEPMAEDVYELKAYTPTGSGVDAEERSKNFGRGADPRDRNIYLYQAKSGKLETLIECSNRAHETATCKQYFNLSPVMRAHVNVTYRKELLPHWRTIQSSVSLLLFSFRSVSGH